MRAIKVDDRVKEVELELNLVDGNSVVDQHKDNLAVDYDVLVENHDRIGQEEHVEDEEVIESRVRSLDYCTNYHYFV